MRTGTVEHPSALLTCSVTVFVYSDHTDSPAEVIVTISETPRPVISGSVTTFDLMKFCYGELELNEDDDS